MTENEGGDGAEGAGKQKTPSAEAEQQDKGGKPNGDWIPKSRLDEVLGEVRELKRELREKTDKPKPEEPTREFSRAELAASVEKGNLTQEQANDLWERQLVERATKAARETASQIVTVKETANRIDAEMRRYKELVPNVMREGTDERSKVAEEYSYLVSLGEPEDRRTELKALRSAFGSVEKLEKSRSRAKPDVQPDEQTGAGGDAGGGDKDGIKGLTARERDYYRDQISKGRYKDWDAVKEELKHANTALRRKMGARA